MKSTIQRLLDVSSRYFNLIPESLDIALQIAADREHLHIVELLLKVDGININFRGGVLPLFLAAKGGHSAIVELLLAADDVDPNVGDRHSTPPLCLACQKGHVSVVRQLLARDDVVRTYEIEKCMLLSLVCCKRSRPLRGYCPARGTSGEDFSVEIYLQKISI